MNTKALYAVIAIVALLIVGLLVYNQSRDDVASENSNATPLSNVNSDLGSNTNTSADLNANIGTNVNGVPSSEGDLDSGTVHEIVFSGTAFTPANLTVKAGDTVVFRNSSQEDFWPASGPHPQHTLYPEFDAKKAIAPGNIYSFKFLKVGEWPFHDHLRPAAFGKITVTE